MPVNPATLSLNGIVDVIINISPLAAPRATFNQLLIVGTSTHIPSCGVGNTRIRVYENLTQMRSDGFLPTDPEYISAGLYFDQPQIPLYVWIGRQDLTALSTLQPTAGNAGSDYVEGDIITVVQSNGTLGTAQIETVDVNGSVLTLAPVLGASGTGYSVANSLPTTGGTGNGLEVDITAVSEALVDALMVCRAVNYQWYVGMGSAVNNGGVITPYTDADHLACAAWAQNAQPNSIYAGLTSDSDILNGVAGNLLAQLQGFEYNRCIMQVATTQNGLYPNNIYATAAIMGYAMGANTGLANTAYTLMFKGEVGCQTEPLTPTQVNNILGPNGWDGNVYLNYGNFYNIFQPGTMSNGQFFDEILNLDMLANDMQLSAMDLLYGTPKVPQTDAGATQEIHVVSQACNNALVRGFLGPGLYTGQPLLNLNTGDALPNGYLVQAPPYSTQTQADRQARKSVPLYVSIIESGAVHSLTIQVNVQR